MGELSSIPWVMTIIAAAVFAFIGYRAGRVWYAWAIGAALLTLVITTWIGGLFLASYLPVLESESSLRFKTVLFSGLFIALPAALFAWRLKPERPGAP